MSRLGEALHTARIAAGLTQAQLADRAEVTRQPSQEHENGLRDPDPAPLERLASAVGVNTRLLANMSRIAGSIATEAHMRRRATAPVRVWRRGGHGLAVGPSGRGFLGPSILTSWALALARSVKAGWLGTAGTRMVLTVRRIAPAKCENTRLVRYATLLPTVRPQASQEELVTRRHVLIQSTLVLPLLSFPLRRTDLKHPFAPVAVGHGAT